MSRRNLGLAETFGAPLVLVILSLIGLVGALLADGAWDWIGAGLLMTTVLAIFRAYFGRWTGRSKGS